MRIGSNPAKDAVISSHYYHRIIVPVYVPNLEGYFENGLGITKLSINSIIKTRHDKSYFTVVNNGSCNEVKQFLQELFDKGAIDQLIHNTENVGKIDAVIPIARSSEEPLITISDGDVLFKQGWMQAVEKVYTAFPEAGMVSPVPHGTVYANRTSNTIFDACLKGILKFQQVCDPKDMLLFAKSIGKKDTMYKKSIRLKYQLTVQRKEVSAVVGCGHFVSTLRKKVFDKAPSSLSKMAYAPKADHDYIDIPNEKAGFWRLATTGNFAYHIGNTTEEWMLDAFRNTGENSNETTSIPLPKKTIISPSIKRFVVQRLLLNRIVRPYFFKYLGLKEGSREY